MGMFEREIVDAMFVKRWGIVRILIPQSVAEHTFAVIHYANDIAIFLQFGPVLHLSLMQYALWHDSKDEIFTGDLPGPNKRGLLDAIGPEAKEKWNAKLREWADRVFENLGPRCGGSMMPDDLLTALLTVKTADWMESAIRMATETQMGNQCAERHIKPNMIGALETAKSLIEHLYDVKIDLDHVPFTVNADREGKYYALAERITGAVHAAQFGHSIGPWITKEDDSRTYKDPCVDADQ